QRSALIDAAEWAFNMPKRVVPWSILCFTSLEFKRWSFFVAPVDNTSQSTPDGFAQNLCVILSKFKILKGKMCNEKF
ncbi:MAG: hypothetical protein IJN85_04115, partial [Oscillospiraceae bacterium]|nr:hypothetical protein [Oscillospiraceae bacterium]